MTGSDRLPKAGLLIISEPACEDCEPIVKTILSPRSIHAPQFKVPVECVLGDRRAVVEFFEGLVNLQG